MQSLLKVRTLPRKKRITRPTGPARQGRPPLPVSAEVGDLLRDVLYLDERLSTEANPDICSIYARATIIMGFAAIEAATDDALATIHELLKTDIPDDRLAHRSSALASSGFQKAGPPVLGCPMRVSSRQHQWQHGLRI